MVSSIAGCPSPLVWSRASTVLSTILSSNKEPRRGPQVPLGFPACQQSCSPSLLLVQHVLARTGTVQSPWVLAHIAAGFLHISLRLFVLAGSIMHIFSDETISRVLINCLDLVFLSKLLQRHNSFFILVIWL